MEETNPFAKFQATKKQVEIKSLGATVTLRQQTIAEQHAYNASVYNEVGLEEKLRINYAKIGEANLGKVASCMLDPKMTLIELQTLGQSAEKVIAEILLELEDWDGSDRRMKAESKRLATENGTNSEDEYEKLLGNSGN